MRAEGGAAVALPRREVGQHRDLHVEQREIDVSPDPGTGAFDERGAHTQRGGDPAAVVDVGDARLRRRPVGLAGQAHHARQRLDRVVVSRALRVGSGLAVTGERARDDRPGSRGAARRGPTRTWRARPGGSCRSRRRRRVRDPRRPPVPPRSRAAPRSSACRCSARGSRATGRPGSADPSSAASSGCEGSSTLSTSAPRSARTRPA